MENDYKKVRFVMMETGNAVRRNTDTRIFGIFKEGLLENIASKLMGATGIPFFAIDYRGENVTRYNNYPFFQSEGNIDCAKELRIMYALAAAKSAIHNKPYRFQSPKGYLNMVIPIIINGQYIGAIAGGPVRCQDKTSAIFMDDLSKELTDKQISIRKDANITSITLEQFDAIVELASFMVEMLSRQAKLNMSMDSYEEDKNELNSLRERNLILQKQADDLEYHLAVSDIPSELITNLLTIASSFSVIEKAPKTENILCRFASLIRYHMNHNGQNTTIKDELKTSEDILSIIGEQYGKKLSYRINCEEELQNIHVPTFTIVPFILCMVEAILNQGNENGTIYVDVEIKESICQITLQLEGDGKEKTDLLAPGRTGVDLEEHIQRVKKRLSHDFDDAGDIYINGNLVHIEFPYHN